MPFKPAGAGNWAGGSAVQAIDAPGRPPAHKDFLLSHDALVGNIPDEEARWRRRHNY